MIDATGLSKEELKDRAERDGFLYFKGLIPRNEILELRRQILEQVKEEGLLAMECELMDGIADIEVSREKAGYGVSCGTPVLYKAVQSLPAFHAMSHHPKLIEIYKTLFGEEVLVHPRNIMRLMFPGKDVAPTPPHQDIIYINGTTNTWTAWIPIGDCPIELGNLAVLKGSHMLGVLPVRTGKGAGGLTSILDGVDEEWVEFDYQAGDVLTFTSLTVHKALPTQRPAQIRLSLDYRYQPVSEPVHESSLKPHMNIAGWEEIYMDWPSGSKQNYWENFDLDVTKKTWLGEHPETVRR